MGGGWVNQVVGGSGFFMWTGSDPEGCVLNVAVACFVCQALIKPPRSVDLARWLYSWAMASTAATIVSGAVAERVHFRAYLWFVTLYSALVYPMLVHWTWSPLGFLSVNAEDRLFGCGVLEVAG